MKNKNIIIILLAIIISVGILVFTMYKIDMERMKHNYPVVFSTWGTKYTPPEIKCPVESEYDIVIIKNGNINNENLIEDFINLANSESEEEQNLIIREYISDEEYIEKELKFIPGAISNKAQEGENVQVNIDEFKKQQGNFMLITHNNNNNESTDTTRQLNAFDYRLKRKVENGIVNFYFDTSSSLIQSIENPIICSYNLESSNYTKKFDLNFNQEKHLGIDTIIDKNENQDYDFSIYTYGGDVSFTFETDMVYTFENALKQKVITVEDILNQAAIDAEYGICQRGYYSDGGSVEFCYDNYTILKFNTLDENKDLVIGISGQIINEVDDLIK